MGGFWQFQTRGSQFPHPVQEIQEGRGIELHGPGVVADKAAHEGLARQTGKIAPLQGFHLPLTQAQQAGQLGELQPPGFPRGAQLGPYPGFRRHVRRVFHGSGRCIESRHHLSHS